MKNSIHALFSRETQNIFFKMPQNMQLICRNLSEIEKDFYKERFINEI